MIGNGRNNAVNTNLWERQMNEDLANVSIDFSALEQRFQGRAPFVDKLLNLALSEYEKSPDQLAEIIAQRDFKELNRFAHMLKGMSANIMALRVNAAAKHVEEQAKIENEQVFEDAVELKIALKDMFNTLKNRTQ